eukprot:Rhum_TRINITY_DN7249_c0_g1::Rhum_TRINITY_DN7249_c0_g1_i1::g.22290::m.22290
MTRCVCVCLCACVCKTTSTLIQQARLHFLSGLYNITNSFGIFLRGENNPPFSTQEVSCVIHQLKPSLQHLLRARDLHAVGVQLREQRLRGRRVGAAEDLDGVAALEAAQLARHHVDGVFGARLDAQPAHLADRLLQRHPRLHLVRRHLQLRALLLQRRGPRPLFVQLTPQRVQLLEHASRRHPAGRPRRGTSVRRGGRVGVRLPSRRRRHRRVGACGGAVRGGNAAAAAAAAATERGAAADVGGVDGRRDVDVRGVEGASAEAVADFAEEREGDAAAADVALLHDGDLCVVELLEAGGLQGNTEVAGLQQAVGAEHVEGLAAFAHHLRLVHRCRFCFLAVWPVCGVNEVQIL